MLMEDNMQVYTLSYKGVNFRDKNHFPSHMGEHARARTRARGVTTIIVA